MAKGQPTDGDDDASKIVIFTNDVKKSENINAILGGGPGRIRTGVQGFAILWIASLPPGRCTNAQSSYA